MSPLPNLELDLLERIKKLQAKAASCEAIGSFAEAEVFAAKVGELLARYKLSLVDVDALVQDTTNPFGEVRVYATPEEAKKVRHTRLWYAEALAKVVAEAHFCHRVLNSTACQVIFVGRQTDREISVYMFHYLMRIMLTEATNAYKVEVKQYNIQLVAAFKAIQEGRQTEFLAKFKGKLAKIEDFLDGFYKGFIDTIEARYKDEVAKLTAESSTNAIVLSKANVAAKTWAYLNMNIQKVATYTGTGSNTNANSAGARTGAGTSLNRHGLNSGNGQRQIGNN